MTPPLASWNFNCVWLEPILDIRSYPTHICTWDLSAPLYKNQWRLLWISWKNTLASVQNNLFVVANKFLCWIIYVINGPTCPLQQQQLIFMALSKSCVWGWLEDVFFWTQSWPISTLNHIFAFRVNCGFFQHWWCEGRISVLLPHNSSRNFPPWFEQCNSWFILFGEHAPIVISQKLVFVFNTHCEQGANALFYDNSSQLFQ